MIFKATFLAETFLLGDISRQGRYMRKRIVNAQYFYLGTSQGNSAVGSHGQLWVWVALPWTLNIFTPNRLKFIDKYRIKGKSLKCLLIDPAKT